MKWLRGWLVRLGEVFRKKRRERDLAAELETHLQLHIEDNLRAGMNSREARREALMKLGGVEQTKEIYRERHGLPVLETFFQDLRYGARLLGSNLGFTATAILTLALGIGANTAIFSHVNAWMIRPLPYPQPERLMVFVSHDKRVGWTRNDLTSTASFLDFQSLNSSFEQTASWAGWNFNLTGDGPPALVEGGRVSWNYFETLGVKPLLGRTFAPEEDHPGSANVAVLGEGLWKSRYASDRRIVGRNITIDGESYTVIGVMPGTFQFPIMGLANLWTPLALTDKARADRGTSWFSAFGRLKPGVTSRQAEAESVAIFERLEKQFPQTNTNLTLLISSMTWVIARNEGAPEMMICFCMVGLTLLIACANVANLTLARATNRAKEFAVRGALGATRNRLVRQLLTESLLLFFFGGAAGVLFGFWGMRWMDLQIPDHIRGYLVNYGHVEMDSATLTYTLGLALLCGLFFGLAPAYENSRLKLNGALKEVSGQASSGKRAARLRRILVASEIALAVVVLISATLLVKSFVISVRSSPGYNPANVMVAQLALPKTKYAEESRQRNFAEEVLARLQTLPQAVSVGAASSVPFGGFGGWVDVDAVGKPTAQPAERLGAQFTSVSSDYFSTMQFALIKGRFFTSADAPGRSPSAIINQTLARQFWPNEDPIGRQFRFGQQQTVCTIVGVVNDIKMYHLRSRPGMQMYVPLAQFPSATLGFVVRTAANSATMAAAIRDSIWAVDHDQPISSVEQFQTLMTIVETGNRVLAKLIGFFGVLAVFLGTIGIYGVMSHLVSQRTHEIGIRAALGATPRQVMRMVIGQGLKLALIGVAIGVLVALGAAQLFAAMLYQVTPNDPVTFFFVPIIFAGVTAAACYLPARRAMRVDPIVALRYE